MLWVNISLVPLFIGTLITGLKLHEAAKSGFYDHWVIPHIVTALLMLIMMIFHSYYHWGWYKSLFKTTKNKSKLSIAISILFFVVVLTGIVDMFLEPNSAIGLLHNKIGLFMVVFSFFHLITRFRWIKNATKNSKSIHDH